MTRRCIARDLCYFVAASNWRSTRLPRFTALSSACCALALPANAPSSSFGDDVADLHEIAEAQAARVLGRRPRGHLDDRQLGAGMLVVEAAVARRFIGRLGDRQIAGGLVEAHLLRRLRHESEELGDALVLLRLLAGHHPEAGAADDRVLRRALDVGIIGQLADAEGEFGAGLGEAEEARGVERHAAFAADEFLIGLDGAAAVVEGLVLLRLGEVGDVARQDRIVEVERRVGAVHAIRLGAERQIVPGAELLHLDPGEPRAGEAAGITRGADLLGVGEKLGPGLRRRRGIDPGLGEGVLVVIEDRRRAVERQRQHLAVGGAVISGDRRQIRAGIEALAGFRHELIDRLHRAFRGHHRRRADLEDLHDRRRLAGAERGDRRLHGVGVAALVDGHDLVAALRAVELVGHLVDELAIDAGHGMPPLDLDGRVLGERGRHHGKRQRRRQQPGLQHGHSRSSPERAPRSRGACRSNPRNLAELRRSCEAGMTPGINQDYPEPTLFC